MQENKTNQEVKQPEGWGDVIFTPEMPLTVLIEAMNILNQRLVTIEDLITIPAEDGKEITLSEHYHKQAMAEMEKHKQEQENKGE